MGIHACMCSTQTLGGCRERAAGYYTELAWALGEMVVEIPYLLLQASLYSLITYFMIWFEINAGARPSRDPVSLSALFHGLFHACLGHCGCLNHCRSWLGLVWKLSPALRALAHFLLLCCVPVLTC